MRSPWGEVWNNVRVQQAALSKNVGMVVNSPASPSSLQLALENDKVQAEVAKFREAITKQVGEPAGVVGFVTVVNGQVTGAEAFGSHTLFRKAWAKAVNAAAVEAVAEKPTRPFSEMTAAGVKTFLANAGREQREAEREPWLAEYQRLRESVATGAGPTQRLSLAEGFVAFAVSDVPVADITIHEPVGDNLQSANNNLTPQRSQLAQEKGTVVEYREKGNGAVIHKSFLPK